MIERILLPLDGAPLAERALPYAMRLASATGARLILMHATVPTTTPSTPDFDVEGFARQLRGGQSMTPPTSMPVQIDAVTREVLASRIAEGICETVVEQAADLVVMATHADSGLGRWLHGSVADQVLCQSPVPVVLIPPACERTWPDDGTLRILVPLDGSRLAEEMLEPVGTLGAALKTDLVLVGAASPLGPTYGEGVSTGQAGFGAVLQETHEYLDGVAARLRAAGRTVTVDAEVGQPRVVVESISRRRQVDLIAMTTHGRTGMARLALGSVAYELLRSSTVPLMVWRPSALRHAEESASATVSAR